MIGRAVYRGSVKCMCMITKEMKRNLIPVPWIKRAVARVKPESAKLLGRKAFGDEHAALHRAQTERLDRLIGGRVIPGVGLLRAIECDHHNALGRAVAIEAL